MVHTPTLQKVHLLLYHTFIFDELQLLAAIFILKVDLSELFMIGTHIRTHVDGGIGTKTQPFFQQSIQ